MPALSADGAPRAGVYFGPCMPLNTDWYHYTLTIIATDFDPKALQPGLTREELTATLRVTSRARPD